MRALRQQSNLLLTIERILVLKSVSIFSDLPEAALVDVAPVLEEIELEPETDLFRKGDLGTSMYIVVDGRVRIFDEENTLATLAEGEVFGEMAVLDPEPRMASVRSIDRTRLLRMDHDALYELMTEYPELALGIIRMLCRRLRNAAK